MKDSFRLLTMHTALSSKTNFINGLKAGIPIIIGYWAIATTCGAIGIVCGLTFWQVEALCFFLYAGSAQLVFCSLWATHATILQLVMAVALINLRYLFMGTYVAKFFRNTNIFQKILNSALITDETFGVASHYAKQNGDKAPFFWLLGLNLMAFVNWFAANTTGALIGGLIPSWANESLSFSLIGMFIGLLVLTIQASNSKMSNYFTAIIAIIATIIFHKHIDKHLGIILISLFSALCGAIFYKNNQGKN